MNQKENTAVLTEWQAIATKKSLSEKEQKVSALNGELSYHMNELGAGKSSEIDVDLVKEVFLAEDKYKQANEALRLPVYTPTKNGRVEVGTKVKLRAEYIENGQKCFEYIDRYLVQKFTGDEPVCSCISLETIIGSKLLGSTVGQKIIIGQGANASVYIVVEHDNMPAMYFDTNIEPHSKRR